MWNMIWPILIVVGSNTVYNIMTKSTPGDVNPFVSLGLTYIVAALSCVIMFFATAHHKNIITELSKTNFTAWALGLAIVGLEVGYIFIYRAGWKVSSASLVANISLAVILLIVGVILYKEVISVKQLIGMAVCGLGLWLIAK